MPSVTTVPQLGLGLRRGGVAVSGNPPAPVLPRTRARWAKDLNGARSPTLRISEAAATKAVTPYRIHPRKTRRTPSVTVPNTICDATLYRCVDGAVFHGASPSPAAGTAASSSKAVFATANAVP